MRCASLLASVLLAGCSDQLGVPSYPITPSSRAVWAGGSLVLTSASFVGRDTLPIITIAAETLVVARVGDSAVSVAIPTTASGLVNPSVILARGIDTVGAIQVYGFTSSGPGPTIDGSLTPYPPSGTTFLGFANGRIALADLATGSATSYGGPADTGLGRCLSSVLSSVDDPTVITVARNSSCYVLGVHLGSPITVIDSGPALFGGGYPSIRLSTGVWLLNKKNFIRAQTPTATADDFGRSTVAAGFVKSPGATVRIVPTGFYLFNGAPDSGALPVFDGTTGAHAYILPISVRLAFDATFTAAGDTLFVVGEAQAGNPDTVSIVALATQSGLALGSRAIAITPPSPGIIGWAVAADPASPWLYVASASMPRYSSQGTLPPSVYVLDRRTMTLVGRMTGPSEPLTSYGGYAAPYLRLAVGADHTLYEAFNSWGSIPTPPVLLYRWSLP